MFGLLISIVCLLVVAFIAWWFFAEHEKVSGHARQKSGYQEIEVEVMGGYSPETIVLKKNVPARIILTARTPPRVSTKWSFQTLAFMKICLWVKNMSLKLRQKKRANMGIHVV